MLLVTAEEMRTLDRLTIEKFGTPGHVLMERAGRGATDFLVETFACLRRKGARVVVCAGKGNNGGDGFVVARLLRRRGIHSEVLLFGRAGDMRGDAERNLQSYRRGRGKIVELQEAADLGVLDSALARADVVVDAIFGTGLSSAVRGLQAEAIERINRSGVPVFAVDMPSGLDADTGLPLGACVRAEATATFGFAKIGQVTFPGAGLVGRVHVVDIGIAPQAIAESPPRAELLEAEEVGRLVPVRSPDTHKGHCGHVLVIAGSFGKTGAAQLVARAATRSGAGLVTLVGPASLYNVYASGVLEVMTEVLPDRDGRMLFEESSLRQLVDGKSAVVIGPGIGTHDEAFEIVRWLLAQEGLAVLLDADAITCLSRDLRVLDGAAASAVLTPHPGEMARLLETTPREVQADRAGTARRFAEQHACSLVLKGARTVIAARQPSGQGTFLWVNPTGNPGMASGGMGDTLSGIIGGLLAQGLAPADAARLGVYVHGAAGDRAAEEIGDIGLAASDLADRVPGELRVLLRTTQAPKSPVPRVSGRRRAASRKS